MRGQTIYFTKKQKKLVSLDPASQVKHISKAIRSEMMVWKSLTKEISCQTHISWRIIYQWVHCLSLTLGRKQINILHRPNTLRLTTSARSLHCHQNKMKYYSDMISLITVDLFVLIRKCLISSEEFFLMWPNN